MQLRTRNCVLNKVEGESVLLTSTPSHGSDVLHSHMNSRTREHTHAHMHKIEIKIVMFIDFVGEEIKKGSKARCSSTFGVPAGLMRTSGALETGLEDPLLGWYLLFCA